MKIAFALSLLVGSATAFAPVQTSSHSSSALKAFENDIGAANLPSGEAVCWDPLGFVDDGNQERFDRLREVEIKHGRVAMLATLGYASTWGTEYRFPGCESFPGGHAAIIGDGAIPTVDLLAPILAIGGFLEFVVFKQKQGSFPGDMGGGAVPVGFNVLIGGPADEEAETILRTKELLNGRAAQMGILGMMVHEQLDGKPFIFFEKFVPYFPGPVAI